MQTSSAISVEQSTPERHGVPYRRLRARCDDAQIVCKGVEGPRTYPAGRTHHRLNEYPPRRCVSFVASRDPSGLLSRRFATEEAKVGPTTSARSPKQDRKGSATRAQATHQRRHLRQAAGRRPPRRRHCQCGLGRAEGERLCRQRGRLTPRAPALRQSHSRTRQYPKARDGTKAQRDFLSSPEEDTKSSCQQRGLNISRGSWGVYGVAGAGFSLPRRRVL
jgi:hypothetical protein